ncbi:glycosyltransferase family 4 protein [Anoxybacillus kestanbolensis]|uniref:glycosyltransferase family 4 protein n=1 Tax=Anoxybacillus kestanbolensis TaxID=227476 RepID=UPI003D202F22
MNIGIDITILRGDRITGIERTLIEIINRLNPENFNGELYIFCHSGLKQFLNEKVINNKKLNFLFSPFRSRIFTEQIWLPYILKRKNIDLVHFTTLGPPLLYTGKFTILVHDAIPWLYKETISKGMKYYYRPLLERAIKSKHLQILITDSCNSKKDFLELFKLKRDKVKVIPLGVGTSFYSTNPKATVLEKYGIYKNYVLSVGTLEPRKNINGLIKAFEIFKQSTNIDLNLVIVGRKGWLEYFDIQKSIKEDIIITGFVDDEDLPHLIAQAEVFIMPSFYEGFGLPLLEAMSLGVPCISSNTSSLPEVGGEAVVYIDPYDINEIAKKLDELLKNKEKMKLLSELGKEQSKKFSWDKTTNQFVSTINEVVDRMGK